MRKGETGDDGINDIETGKSHKDKFLQDLSVDHPLVASDISSRVQEWKKTVDEKSGVDGFGQAIVDKMVYIQKEEIKEFVVSILEEMRDIWKENPDKPICFVATDEQKGSGKWFYDLVSNLLTDEVKSSGLFFYGHHQRRPSILGVFWHRAQDNMPIVMSEGRLSDHFSPLITLENEKQIKVQY